MFKFLKRLEKSSGLKIPLAKINKIIEERNKLFFNFLPYDVFEKILGMVLFDFLEFYDHKNYLPEKRLDLFHEKIKEYTIEKDFEKLFYKRKIYELSILLDNSGDHFKNNSHEGYGLITTHACVLSFHFDYLDVMELLLEKNKKFSKEAINVSAENGNLILLKWLKENKPEIGCDSLDLAAGNGHLEVLIWLKENYPEIGCTKYAMDRASRHGHLEVVKYLHENYPEVGCTTDAIDYAAENGFLEIVEFLIKNRTEGCTKWAMIHAVRRWKLPVVYFLFANGFHNFLKEALEFITLKEQLELLYGLEKYLNN